MVPSILNSFRAAVAEGFFKDLMTITNVEQCGGRVLWHVGSATRGSGFWVTVGDATGKVVDQKSWGIR